MKPDELPAPTPLRNPLAWLQRAMTRLPRNIADVNHQLNLARQQHLLSPEVHAIVRRAVNVQDTRVRDIMLPRPQIQILRLEDSLEDWLKEIDASKHSRYPVSKGELGEIVGLLMTKDLMSHIHDDERGSDSQRRMIDRDILLRPALHATEGQRIIELLGEFRVRRSHMAVVLDEHGNTAGLVTLEDALEEIIGEIEDEHDHMENRIVPRDGGSVWEVDALTPVEQFNERFKTSLDSKKAGTIGGYITQQLARVPTKGEQLQMEDLHLDINKTDKRRILSLLVKRDSDDSEAS